jgi:serine/threonine-protein kinase
LTSEKWRRVEELFVRALEADPSQITALLAELGAEDPEVRAAVERLLKDEHRSFLRTMTVFHRPQQPEARRDAEVFANGSLVAGRYRIVRFLGAGGMGEVYEAADLTLGQPVALKTILPQAAGHARSLKRFKQETALARKVTHANVCRVFDVGVHREPKASREFLFLTMELLAGEPLSQRIRRTGRLESAEAVPLIRQMAEALAAAHNAEVVHGDFKPGNVMLAAGKHGQTRAVVMDFGLARSLAEDPEAVETRTTGVVAGTPPYMAPELFAGVPASACTDVYALGIVVFEVMTGARPFRGDSPLAELIKRTMERAPSLKTFVPGMGDEWDRIIERCLAVKPEARFADARQVANALEEIERTAAVAPRGKARWRWASLAAGLFVLLSPLAPPVREQVIGWMPWAVSLPSEKRVVVLPFTNVGRASSLQVLCDGLVETLTSQLSTIGAGRLAVVPASEVFRGGVTRIPDARHEFNANLAVTGSVQQGTGGIRLTLNLVNAVTLQQIASAVIDDASGDLHHLQDAALQKLAELLRISEEQGAKTGRAAGAPDPAAYEPYLRAVGYLQRWDKGDNLAAAITLLEQCVEQDRQFALGYARLAEAYRMKFALEKGGLWLDSAMANAKRAAQLNPSLAPVQVTLGKVYSAMGETELAIEALQRGMRLDAHSSEAHGALAGLYEKLGRYEEGEDAYKRALALQPDSWRPRGALAEFYFRRHRYPDAIREWRKVLEMTPDNSVAHVNLGACFSEAGQAAEARTMYEKAIAIKPNYTAYMNLGAMDFRDGRYAEAAKRFEKALELNDKDYLLWGNLATAYWWARGTREKAAPAFERAAEMAARALRLRSRDAFLHADLAGYYGKLRRADLAAARIETALALAPADKEILAMAAEVYETMGRRAKAVELARKALDSGYPMENLERNPEVRDLLKDLQLQAKR